jgi:hypothetical protein
MLKDSKAFSGFSTGGIQKAKAFYAAGNILSVIEEPAKP